MAINVSVQHSGGFLPGIIRLDPILLPSGNPFKCHEEVLSLQSMIPCKRFDIFPLTGGYSEGLEAFGFYFKPQVVFSFLQVQPVGQCPF